MLFRSVFGGGAPRGQAKSGPPKNALADLGREYLGERDGKIVYRFDIRLQGGNETVFFDM